MTNSYFNVSGNPATGTFVTSAPVRNEFAAIEDGFDKLPALTASTAVVVNSAGTALTNTTGTFALAGNFATAGAFNTTGAFGTTLAQTATVTLTLPAVSGTLATLAGAETLTNKTLTAVTAFGIRSSGSGAFDMRIANTENLTAARTLTVALGDSARTLTFTGDVTVTGSNTGDQTITLTGDVTGSGTGSFATTIANNAVTLAKMANMATTSMLGRSTAGTGVPEVLSASTARTVMGLGTAAVEATGTSLHTIPFLDGGNTWSGVNSFNDNVGFTASTFTVNTSTITCNGINIRTILNISGTSTPSTIGSSQNDYAIGNTVSVFRISADAAWNITGITGGSSLQPVRMLFNVGSFNITLKNKSASSSAANQFAIGADIVLAPDQGCCLIYDNTSSYWRCIGKN